jgi:uncharacterized protein
MPAPVARVALFLAGYMLVLLGTSVFKGMSPPPYADVVWGALSSLALVALTWGFLRRERRTFADVAMRPDRHTIGRLLLGLLAGGAVYPLTLWLISRVITPLHLSAPTWPSVGEWVLTLASLLALACMEELGFRAYALRTLVPAIGRGRAQLAIAAAFGLTHLAYGWPWSAVLPGVIPSGLLFGAVAISRGGLAGAIGVHVAVNLAQWVLGAKATPGVWAVHADPAETARLASSAPLLAAVVTLLVTGLVWLDPVAPRASVDTAVAD